LPQFDIVEFSNIYLWFFLIFIYFYIFWAMYIIPQLFKALVIRKFIINNNNINFINNKILLLTSKNKILSLIFNYKYNFFKFIKNDF
jgi:hypothetical protein